MLEVNSISMDQTVICSPTARKNKIFGDVKHLLPTTDSTVTKIIGMFHDENRPRSNVLTKLISEHNISNPVFACTEISAQASTEGLSGHDTLLATIKKIVSEL